MVAQYFPEALTWNAVRTALIGCGKVGEIHAAALHALPEADFVAACDADLGRAPRPSPRRYGARAFTDVAHDARRGGRARP